MSYAFGWWDYEEIYNEPQMICRDSDERVVMVCDLADPWLAKAIAEHPKRPADRWKRFEYRHEEFWFPLIVNWVPEEGRILVDYNLSSELWRQETNAETEYPPYGGWVRVDDMVPDAFWCWPEYLKSLAAVINTCRYEGEGCKLYGIVTIGHWCGSRWYESSKAFHRINSNAGHSAEEINFDGPELYNNHLRIGSTFEQRYLEAEQMAREIMPINQITSPSDWQFRLSTAEELNANINQSGIPDLEVTWYHGADEPYLVLEDGTYPYVFSSDYEFLLQPTLPIITYPQYHQFFSGSIKTG